MKTIVTLFFCFYFIHSTAQQKYPNTFLWKITGKGLTKPSYLFGTMHLTDRQLFYFTDSTYDAIEKTDGFAIEINPQDMADSLLSKLDFTDRSVRVKDMLSEKEYNKLRKRLEQKYKIPADELTTKQIQTYRKEKLYKSKEGDMPTFIDMYLYNIAQQQDKWTGGIEDINDQLGLMDEIGGKITPENIVNEDSAEVEKFIDKAKKIYLKQDLAGIESIFNYSDSADYDHLDMIKRNHKMAKRIDSISAIRSCFFAVGVAHLPGDSGVIKFLQDKGFTVAPVLSNKKIAPEAYIYTHKEKEWLSFSDETKAYIIKMPGKPTLVKANEVLPIYMYMDLSTMSAFGVGVIGASDAGANLQEKIKLMVESYEKSGYDILDKKVIETQGAKGVELFAHLDDKGYYKLQFLGYENKMFMLIFGGQTKEACLSPTGTRFLNSIIINKEDNLSNESWNTFTDQQCGISLLMPGKVKLKPFSIAKNGGNFKTYAASDLKEGNYYMLVISDVAPGYYIKDDSSTWAIYLKQYKSSMKIDSMDKIPFRYHGYDACKYIGHKKENGHDLFVECIAFLRGSRCYQAWAIAPEEKKDLPDISNFFRSINFLAYDSTEWKNQGNNMTFYGPSPFIKNPDAAEMDGQITYYSTDEISNSFFIMEKKNVSKYFWVNNDSLYWGKKLDLLKVSGDSVLYSNHYRSGSNCYADFIISLGRSTEKKRLKYILTNDTIYCLFSFLSNEMYNDKRVKKLFAQFDIDNNRPLMIYDNKTHLLLQDLRSGDSATRSDAIDAIGNAPFSKDDLPELQQAFLYDYAEDSLEYRNINDELADAVIKINNPSTTDFIKNNYTDDRYESLRPKMIHILSRQKTSTSYAVLKDLLLQHRSMKKEIGFIGRYDSLELAKKFFPETGDLLNDSLVGPSLADLAANLIDSNLLSIDVIRPYEEKLVDLASIKSKKFSLDKDAWDSHTYPIIELLCKLNSRNSNAALMQFFKSKELSIKKEAILALLKNKIDVPVKEIYSIAADDRLRDYFYTQLKEANNQTFFPATLKTSQKFAASYAYSYLEEDDNNIISLNFLKEKVSSKSGKKLHYYIFKAVLDNVDDAEVVIVGPFASTNTPYEPEDNEYDKVWVDDQPYSINKIDAAFDRMLHPVEKKSEVDN